MKTIIEEIPTLTIEEFADKHGLTMKVVERRLPIGNPQRFYACFEHVEIRQGESMLLSNFGNGSTPEQAIKNYLPEIELQTMVVNAGTPERKEIEVPRLCMAKAE